MKKFKIGDRVVVRTTIGYGYLVGIHGTVAVIDSALYGVVFDEYFDGGHTLSTDNNPDGFCPDGYGWWLWEDDLEVEPSEDGASDTVTVDEEAFPYA